MRVIVDPGVLISALLSGAGSPGLLVRRWLDGEIEVIGSPRLFDELAEVLGRSKYRPWVSVEDSQAFVHVVEASMLALPDPPPEQGVSPDPGDDYLVVLARSARVDALVTGDGALLAADLGGLVTLTPAQLLAELDCRSR